MTKHHPALLALLAIFCSSCGTADSQSQPAAANSSAAAPAMTPATPGQGVAPAGAPVADFERHIQDYLKIHNQAEGKVPNLKRTDDPKEIADREKALAEMIMTLRANAQPGEIFGPEVQPYLIQIIREDFKQRSAEDRKAIIQELPARMKVDVNTIYPTTIPLATFPPALLRKLPDLPPELEYRLVGRSVILRDVKANLIVDIMRDIVQTIPS